METEELAIMRSLSNHQSQQQSTQRAPTAHCGHSFCTNAHAQIAAVVTLVPRQSCWSGRWGWLLRAAPRLLGREPGQLYQRAASSSLRAFLFAGTVRAADGPPDRRVRKEKK